MKAFIRFFKTSPLSRGRLVLHIVVLGLLAAIFIVGGIYQFASGEDRLGFISFIAIGLIFLAGGIYGINPESCQRHFWHQNENPNHPNLPV